MHNKTHLRSSLFSFCSAYNFTALTRTVAGMWRRTRSRRYSSLRPIPVSCCTPPRSRRISCSGSTFGSQSEVLDFDPARWWAIHRNRRRLGLWRWVFWGSFVATCSLQKRVACHVCFTHICGIGAVHMQTLVYLVYNIFHCIVTLNGDRGLECQVAWNHHFESHFVRGLDRLPIVLKILRVSLFRSFSVILGKGAVLISPISADCLQHFNCWFKICSLPLCHSFPMHRWDSPCSVQKFLH